MSLDSALPSGKHLGIVLLFRGDSTLVLDLSQLSSSFVIHFVLQIAAHGSVTLSDLSEDISLVSLLAQSILKLSLLVNLVLSIDFRLDVVLLILSEPIRFTLELLLQFNVSFTVLVHILQQVNASLVLTTPLLLSHVPLLIVFFSNEAVNHLLVSFFIGFLLLVVVLKLNSLLSDFGLLSSFSISDCLFVSKRFSEQILISLFLVGLSLPSKKLLSLVVVNQFKVALSVQQEFLSLVVLLALFFLAPLSLEHLLLISVSR